MLFMHLRMNIAHGIQKRHLVFYAVDLTIERFVFKKILMKYDGLVKSLLDLFFKISDAQNSAY